MHNKAPHSGRLRPYSQILDYDVKSILRKHASFFVGTAFTKTSFITESKISNEQLLKSCLGRVFNARLGCISRLWMESVLI